MRIGTSSMASVLLASLALLALTNFARSQCIANPCGASDQTSFTGEFGLVWMFTESVNNTEQDGKCEADCSTKECHWFGTLKVTNNTGASRTIHNQSGAIVALLLNGQVTNPELNVDITSGCGVSPAKSFKSIDPATGQTTSAYQFICEACLGDDTGG